MFMLFQFYWFGGLWVVRSESDYQCKRILISASFKNDTRRLVVDMNRDTRVFHLSGAMIVKTNFVLWGDFANAR